MGGCSESSFLLREVINLDVPESDDWMDLRAEISDLTPGEMYCCVARSASAGDAIEEKHTAEGTCTAFLSQDVSA